MILVMVVVVGEREGSILVREEDDYMFCIYKFIYFFWAK